MNSTAEKSATERRQARPVLCAFLGLIIVTLAVTVLPRLGSAVGQYRSAKKGEMAAAERYAKAVSNGDKVIKEVGLSEYARRTSTTASAQDSTEARHDTSGVPQPKQHAVLEETIRQTLASSAARQNLGWRCTRVRLVQSDANTYLGFAEFDKAKPLAFELTTGTDHQSFGFSRLLSRADWEEESRNTSQNKPDVARNTEETGGSSEAILELQSWRWYTANGFVLTEGTVENVSGRKLANVEVVVIFMDASGDLVTSADAHIKYDPILPGQVSPFTVFASENPAITKASIDFKEFMGGSIKWRMRDRGAEPNAVRPENTPGTSVRGKNTERQTPLSDDDIKRLRGCQIGYANDGGLAAVGVSLGEFLDRLSASQTSPPGLTQSADGQTVVTIKEGTKTISLLFACDASRGICAITGGEINDQEIGADAALAVMLGLAGQ